MGGGFHEGKKTSGEGGIPRGRVFQFVRKERTGAKSKVLKSVVIYHHSQGGMRMSKTLLGSARRGGRRNPGKEVQQKEEGGSLEVGKRVSSKSHTER